MNITQKFSPFRTWDHTFTLMYGVEEDNETNIDEVKDENGEMNSVYDLQGRKVNNPVKGIYVVNGKKTICK